MRIAVFGVGGVGGYFGGRLAKAGEDVTFVARGAHLEALRTQGLRVDSIQGDFTVKPVQATDDPKQVGVVDVVFVTVKAWQVPEAAEAIRPLVGPETCVIPLQNGVESAEQLASVFGQSRVVGGVCLLVSFIAGPGHIRHVAVEPVVKVGELDNRPSARLDLLRQSFERAGVKIELVDDIQLARWTKFIFIAPWSGVGALTKAPIGVWRSLPETRAMVEQAIGEAIAVGRARGVNLPADAVQKTLAAYDSALPGATASMQRDIMAGRPSELDAQTGAIVRLGKEAGVATPVNSLVYAGLLPLELKARGRIEFPV